MKIFLDTFSHFIRENKLDMQKILENVTIKIDLLGEKVNWDKQIQCFHKKRKNISEKDSLQIVYNELWLH